ncbi:hypothetical protein Syun_013685 [Stephania yunnanensis]|uniref:IST1-like protein n=1 Tax=Stephania yunnanensis TaxID=152371 RepID=A0AAP0JJY2_9MAGN
MSMFDSFLSKRFNAAKCKTLLKLTIPRIKLLRNRREIQIKQMRRDIAKLLETGQEATARIRVEHIIREENMMAAQEIVELFCELIAVRLPIIETQRYASLADHQFPRSWECPLDLKEAISSVCFAAPRCADLPELLQVQMMFTAKYGKEFVSAATELMPDCGVNRQMIELLSIRAPAREIKLKLLKEIAEEHDVDWDPTAAETELFKSHEDLLNGPSQFVGGSKLPLPKEKNDESLYSAPVETAHEESDSDSGLDSLDLPDVPRVSLRPTPDSGSGPEVVPPHHSFSSPELTHEPKTSLGGNEDILHDPPVEPGSGIPEASRESVDSTVGKKDDKQFLPFITSPSLSNASFSDVLAAAQAAAESAERAAAAARSAASLAQIRITELTKKKGDQVFPNSGHDSHTPSTPDQAQASKIPQFDSLQSFGSADSDSSKHGSESPHALHRQFQKSTSMEDDPYFTYPNLFNSSSSHDPPK